MKVAAILGERQAGLVDVPDPTPKEDWAVVKIHASPMCNEYHAFEHGHKSDWLGHEAAGEVVDIAQPGKVEVGDRVVVMPQYPCGKVRALHRWRLHPLREQLQFRGIHRFPLWECNDGTVYR